MFIKHFILVQVFVDSREHTHTYSDLWTIYCAQSTYQDLEVKGNQGTQRKPMWTNPGKKDAQQ